MEEIPGRSLGIAPRETPEEPIGKICGNRDRNSVEYPSKLPGEISWNSGILKIIKEEYRKQLFESWKNTGRNF